METIQPIIQSPLNKTRADKWICLFNLPEPLKQINKTNNIGKTAVDKSSVQFSLTKVKHPDITVKAISQRYASGNVYFSSHSKEPFDLLNLSFNVDGDYNNYLTIYNWLNLIHDEKYAYPDPNNLISKKDTFNLKTYWTNIGLILLDEYNNCKLEFIYTEAFPTTLSGITYDYQSTEQIQVQASFAFAQVHLKIPDKKIIE